MNLDEIFEAVERAWPFDDKTYPYLPTAVGDGNTARHLSTAQTGHVLLHVMKQAGKLAAIFEPLAHRRRVNVHQDEVAQQVAYLIVDAVRLAQLARVNPEAIAAKVEEYVRQSTQPELCSVCREPLGDAVTTWNRRPVHVVCPTYRANVVDSEAHPYLRHIFWGECVPGGIYKFVGDFLELSHEAAEHGLELIRLTDELDEFEVQTAPKVRG